MLHNTGMHGQSCWTPQQHQCSHIDDPLKQAKCCDCIHYEERKRGANCYGGPDCPLKVDKPKISCYVDDNSKEWYRKVKKEYPPKICPVCGKKFYKPIQASVTAWNKKITCSRSCGSIYVWQRKKESPELKRMYKQAFAEHEAGETIKDLSEKYGKAMNTLQKYFSKIRKGEEIKCYE